MFQKLRKKEYSIGKYSRVDQYDLAAYLDLPHLTPEEKAACAATLQELDELEASLAEAQAQFDAIRAPIQQAIASCEARFGQICNQSHPMRHLPHETMSQIMEVAQSSPARPVMGCMSVRMEILLSHVCRHWRDIALSTPTLWTKIFGPDVGYSTRRAEAYLARSGGCLIDVRLIANTSFGLNLRDKWGREFLMLAAQHSERWRSFTLNLTDTYTRDRAVVDDLTKTLRDRPVPQLQDVDVTIDLPPRYALEEPQIFLRGTPRLSTLKLNTALTSFWLLVPMKTITTLTVQFDCTAIPIIPLFSLPNLRHFSITRMQLAEHHPMEFDLPYDEDVPAALSKLSSLRLPACDLPSLFGLPRSLQQAFSTVRYLFITTHGNLEDMDSNEGESAKAAWEEWPGFLQDELDATHRDIFPSLEHLVADLGWKGYIPALDVDPTLCRLTHNIRSLTIPDGYLNPDKDLLSNSTTWPRLQKFHFEHLLDDEDDFGGLVEWMAERGRQFGTFTLVLTGDPAGGPAWISDSLEGKIQALMGVVQLEKAPRPSLDRIWPPMDK